MDTKLIATITNKRIIERSVRQVRHVLDREVAWSLKNEMVISAIKQGYDSCAGMSQKVELLNALFLSLREKDKHGLEQLYTYLFGLVRTLISVQLEYPVPLDQDTSEVEGLIKEYVPTRFHYLYQAPLSYGDRPGLIPIKSKLQRMLYVLNNVDLWRERIPSRYRERLQCSADREFFNWFILAHALGKGHMLSLHMDGTVQTDGYPLESVRLIGSFYKSHIPQYVYKLLLPVIRLSDEPLNPEDARDILFNIFLDTDWFDRNTIELIFCSAFIKAAALEGIMDVHLRNLQMTIGYWDAVSAERGFGER